MQRLRHPFTPVGKLPANTGSERWGKAAQSLAVVLRVDYSQGVIWWPLIADDPSAGWFFFLSDVVVTNTSPHPMSLMPSLAAEITQGGEGSHLLLDQRATPILSRDLADKAVALLLHGPINLNPGLAVRGHLAFTLLGGQEKAYLGAAGLQASLRRANDVAVFYVVWHDLVSDAEYAHDVTYAGSRKSSQPTTLNELLERKREDRD
jgi:hypothetical protein